MSLEEASHKYDISIYLNPDTQLWHWKLSNISSEKGYYNPNTTKLELIQYLYDNY